jgi:hypothetical protein
LTGCAVITQAASGDPDVKALVYVAAFALDSNEVLSDLATRPVARPIAPADVAATQPPTSAATFASKLTVEPAWKTIPSWYLVANHDSAMAPDLERFMARRIHAHTRQIDGSHAIYISHPRQSPASPSKRRARPAELRLRLLAHFEAITPRCAVRRNRRGGSRGAGSPIQLSSSSAARRNRSGASRKARVIRTASKSSYPVSSTPAPSNW